MPGPSRFQVCVCWEGGCRNHGRALGTPNLAQMGMGILEAFLEAASKLRPVPKQPYRVGSC